ncbi:unnamed protein product [Lupinus luteus]|uniref:Uncharacterized protein n=1 Tax=Lupinus luteus TaxID=3873 RepID=A0AAV1YCE4_LUPLU
MQVVQNPNITVLRSETNRIIEAHNGHFLTLSIIFFLPLSSFYLFHPTLFFQLLNHFYPLLNYQTTLNPNPLFLYLLYSLFVTFFSFCGISSITYSIFHGFYNGTQPLNLIPSIKSIFTSFLPLLATTIVLKLIFLFISLFFSLLLLLLILGTQILGITSIYFPGFNAALVVLPWLFVVVYLQVTWTLVPVIVVLESCWGFEALRRSASLMKGMKIVALTLLLFFGFMEGILIWFSTVVGVLTMGFPNGIPIMKEFFRWGGVFLTLIVAKSPTLMIFLLLNTAANTVLYILCKDIHGERVEKKSEKDYVALYKEVYSLVKIIRLLKSLI